MGRLKFSDTISRRGFNLSVPVALAGLLGFSAPAMANTVSTAGAAGGFDFSCLGMSTNCGQNFGQVFTPTGGQDYLQSLTFMVKIYQGSSVNLNLNVYRWNGSDITGPSLYTSLVTTLASTDYVSLTYAPNILLTDNAMYMAYLSAANLGNTTQQAASQLAFTSNPYAGGSFGYQRIDGNHAWNMYSGIDAYFSMTFDRAPTDVPEPAALLLLGAGLAGAAVVRKRRSS